MTPYLPTNTRAEPKLFKYADKHSVNLIHTPSGAATDDLRANLADPRARAPFVAKEVAVLNESGRFVGTNLDFEGIRDHCPNQTKLNNPCVVGFTALVAELREQFPSRSPGTVAVVNCDFAWDHDKQIFKTHDGNGAKCARLSHKTYMFFFHTNNSRE